MPNSQAEKAYAISLANHITHVQEAGERLGVPEEQLAIHDESKWSDEEFPHYAAYFHSGIDESPLDAASQEGTVSDGFTRAWLHHIHHNPHHWQHWMFPDGFSPEGSSVENGVLPMPENYVREMVADWMGASKGYTGSWDMTDWLNENLHKMSLHSQTWEILREVLGELGYRLQVDAIANKYKVSDASEPLPKPKAISYVSHG